jgi:hypothetical protein
MEHKRQSRADFMKGDTQRKKVLSLCHELGWTYLSTGGRMVVDFHRLRAWMDKYSYLHKPLNYYTPEELPMLITQFEEMVSKEIAK